MISLVRRWMFVVTCLVMLVVGTVHAESALEQQVRRLAQPYLDSQTVAGMTIGIVRQDERHLVGLGRVDLEDTREPDGDTLFEIGSITKVFTGILLADRVQRGELTLDQPIQSILADRATIDPHEDGAIELRHLATHTSGLPRLPDNMPAADPENPYADFTPNHLYEFLNGHALSRGPGAKSEYSNLGMGLLGHLLAVKAGQSYEALMAERITKPLGMNDTVVVVRDDLRERLAKPYTGDLVETKNWDLATLAGAGGIRSTASDMMRFIEAHFEFADNDLGQALKLAWTEHQAPLNPGEFALGLGWHVARDGQTRWHNGQTGGYHSMMLVSQPNRVGVILLANTGASALDALAQDVLRLACGETVEPRTFEEPATVAAEIMQKYVGQYQLVPGFVLTVSIDDGKLMVGATGQPTLQVYPRSDSEWFYKVVPATLIFELDDQGNCNALELQQGGGRHRAERIK